MSTLIQIETARLTLQLLTLEQVELYLLGNNLLEKKMHLPYANRVVDAHFKEVAETIFIPNFKKDKESSLFYSFFILIEKASKQIVGEIGCHGKPTENGDIEIGYSTQPTHQNKRFMTEAVSAFCSYFIALNQVKTIIAETDIINIPSQKILINNHFIKTKEIENSIFWKWNA